MLVQENRIGTFKNLALSFLWQQSLKRLGTDSYPQEKLFQQTLFILPSPFSPSTIITRSQKYVGLYHTLCFLSKKLFFCNKTTQKKDHRYG